MKRMTTRLKLFLILFFTLLMASPTLAQTSSFAEVLVDLWPEYDQPQMLVILHIQLPPDLTLPAEVTVRIPARVGEPHAVAMASADGTLLVAPYQRTVEGEWATLTITASSPTLQVEYYDTLNREGNQRQYTYQWPGFSAVEHLVLRVQQPPDAQDFTLTPAGTPAQRGEDGLMYYTTDLGQLAEGEAFTLEIAYTKSSDALTVQNLQVQPSEPLAKANGPLSVSDWLPWVLAALGLLLIAGGLVWYWQSGAEIAPAPSRRRRRRPKPAAAPSGEVRYCPQCGTRAQPGDRFCRHCGAPLR